MDNSIGLESKWRNPWGVTTHYFIQLFKKCKTFNGPLSNHKTCEGCLIILNSLLLMFKDAA